MSRCDLTREIILESHHRNNILKRFFESKQDGLFYCGHAAIIVRLNRKNFLFDYVSTQTPYGSHWRFCPRQEKVPIDSLAGIFVSHVHKDHFDPGFLRAACRKVPIYVAGGRDSFNKELIENRISYKLLNPDSVMEIEKGVFVQTFLHQSNGVDSSFLIGNGDVSVYHGNDNYIDNLHLTVDKKIFPEISLACIPYAYINWYPQLLENLSEKEKNAESERLVHHSFEYAISQALHLSAKLVLPFGANLFLIDSTRARLNDECKSPYEFVRYVEQTRGVQMSKKILAGLAGDVVTLETNGQPGSFFSNWTEDKYRKVRDRYTGKALVKLGTSTISRKLTPSFNFRSFTSNAHIVFIRPRKGKYGVAVHTDSGVTYWSSYSEILRLSHDRTIVNVDDKPMYVNWLSKRLSMEWIWGSRQFTVKRIPNVYNPEVIRFIVTQL